MKLLVDRLRCLQDTPEWTPDEVYLLVVSGWPGAGGRVRVLTLAAPDWNGLASGAQRDTDLVVDAEFSAEKICVALLMEQDGRRDLARGETLAALERELSETLRLFSSARALSRAEVAEQLRVEVDRCVARLRGNDDPIGRATILQLAAGARSGSLLFHGPGRQYQLDLKVS